MSEPHWMPSYQLELWEGGFRNRPLDTVTATADREVEATAKAKAILLKAWEPGARKGKRARPLIAVVKRVASGRVDEVARLTWTLNGIARA